MRGSKRWTARSISRRDALVVLLRPDATGQRRQAVVDDAGRGLREAVEQRDLAVLALDPVLLDVDGVQERLEVAPHRGAQPLHRQHLAALHLRHARLLEADDLPHQIQPPLVEPGERGEVLRPDRAHQPALVRDPGLEHLRLGGLEQPLERRARLPEAEPRRLEPVLEPVEQRGLEPLPRPAHRHGEAPSSTRRVSKRACSPASVASTRCPSPTQLPSPSCRHSVRWASRSASSPAASEPG